MYNFETSSWKLTSPYPFASGLGVMGHDMIFISEISSFFVSGGLALTDMSQIAKLKDNEWSDAGKLKTPRFVSFSHFLLISNLKI